MTDLNTSDIRVLVVEDELAINVICMRVLSNLGYKVDVASDGILAKEMIKEKKYDLCLVDIRTPGMSGKELYEWCVREKPHQAKKIIFSTGDIVKEETKNFINKSGRPFLPKPFTVEELKAVVKEFFDKKVK